MTPFMETSAATAAKGVITPSSPATAKTPIYGNFGGDGGEGGNNLIVAGGGNDTIYAHCGLPATSHTSGTTAEGQDLIIGGTGTDTVYGWPAGYTLGSNTGDLFIAGTTNLSLSALDAVLAEWDSSDSYATRVADLSGANGPVGANGSNYLISGTTVIGSTAVDEIFGTVDSDDDWYLVTSNDVLNNVEQNEVTLID